MKAFQVGDWVQATEEIAEADFMGHAKWVHAAPGGVGHVLEVLDEDWINVFFEKTGSVSVCRAIEVKRLAGAETGRVRP